MKRILALFLALISVLALAACGAQNAQGSQTSQNTQNTQNTQSTSGTTEAGKNEEKIDFGGHTFTFAIALNSLAGYEVDGYYQNAETIFTAIEERNKKIETLYNCKIKTEDLMSGVLENDFVTGKSTIDVVCSAGANKNYSRYIDLNTLDIDFTKDWWLSDFMKESSFDGTNFYTLCYGSLSAFDYTQVIIFNKSVKNANAALKDVDLYALVESGEWTLDKFHEIVKLASTDTDKSGTIEDYNGEIYGLLCDNNFSANSFYFGAGGKYARNNGEITSAINETSVAVTDKIIALFGDSAASVSSDANVITNTMDGKSMFAVDEIYRIHDYAKGFSKRPGIEIGVLPIPKASAGAGKYISYPEQNMCGISVPKTCTDISRIASFLEVYARHSKETVFPEYKKWIASYADGENTEKMLGYIFEAPTADIAAALSFANIYKEFPSGVINGKNPFKNSIKTFEEVIPKAANSYREQLNASKR